jgi:hypothetical protein
MHQSIIIATENVCNTPFILDYFVCLITHSSEDIV